MTVRNLVLSVLAPALAFTSLAAAGRPQARNVVLFIGDAGGIPTLHAASIHAYDHPQKLFLQRMPHVALMDTSTAAEWVSDSAAGMSAIVTGQKTLNGVLSQSATAVRGQRDGEWLKTILEEAEERGLSTGIVTNMAVTDATPAACYAHVNARSNAPEIVSQLLAPRFGDGVDVVMGAPPALGNTPENSPETLRARFAASGYEMTDSIAGAAASKGRIAMFVPGGNFELQAAIDLAMSVLRRNPRGYFLMIEWDTHTSQLRRGLDRVVALDKAVERVATAAGRDTLVLFAADHSYDLRVQGGRRGSPLVVDDPPATSAAGAPAAPAAKPSVRVDGGHTGEQVLAAAQGPGAEAVRGFISNADLYRVMRQAYGWDRAPVARKRTAKATP